MARAVSSPVFVGRRRELDAIVASLAAAGAGHGALLLIAGEAGVGKTRLIEEALEAARAAGAAAAVGRCVELGASGLPFAPIRMALRDLLGAAAVDGVTARTAALDALVPRAGPPAADADRIGLGPDTSQTRAFEACLDALRDLGRLQPVLIAIEDIHWADPSTLDLLGYLAHGLSDAPIVLIASFRSDELHRRHPLQPFLGELQRVRTTERIELARFSQDEVAQQIGAILGEPPTAGLLERVFKRSDGNAFYAEEVVAAEQSGSGLPPAMRDVLLARVASLGDAARELLRVVAAGGIRVSTAVVARVAGSPREALDEPLREAVDRHLIVPVEVDGDEFVAFRHALVQEAIYAELLPGERTRLHARYGAALDAASGSSEASSPERAYHWFAAHDLPRALAASVAAGRYAAASHAYGDAHGHYERALEVWDQVPDATERTGLDRIALLEFAAKAASENDPARATALMLEAVRSSNEADRTRLALLKERHGRYAWLAGDGLTSIEACREAVRLLPEDAPVAAQARVLASLGQILMVTLQVGEAKAICERAIAAAQAAGDAEVEAHATCSLGVATVYLGNLDLGTALLRRAIGLAEQAGSIDEVDRAESNLVDVLAHSGLLAAAADQTEVAYAHAEANGLARGTGVTTLAEGALALYRLGRWDRAKAMFELAWRQTTSGINQIMVEERLALLDVGQGRFDAAAARLAVARPLIDRVIEAQFVSPLAEAAAELALWRGDTLGARTEIATAFERLEPIEAYISRLGPLFALGVRAEGDAAELARARRDEAAVAASTRIARGYVATISRLRDRAAADLPNFLSQASGWCALCEAEMGRVEGADAPEAWARAAAALDAIPMPYSRTYALWRAAAARLAASRDKAAAKAELTEARRIAIELEASPLLDEIDRLAGRAGIDLQLTDAPPDALPPDDGLGLTRREREILALLAEGRTNRQIADALFITEGTAGTHVSNILGKLGVRGRTEAAAVAHRLNLVE
ncbi:MAG TPA: AAA family ATPase [Candidatus Limnocylindrales bacterium]|nr:AAA family ATPase [Candidatus Limnocylindrales bacterium]